MPYSKFSLGGLEDKLSIQLVDKPTVLPESITPIAPTDRLSTTLEESLPWAIAKGTEKARSEGIIYPMLMEVRRQYEGPISLFSGEEFNVDPDSDLVGYVDFLISLSAEELYIKAPVAIVVEAKRGELKPALGQCIATMVGAHRFNQQQGNEIQTLYGAVTNGTTWQFASIINNTVNIGLTEYSIPPVDNVLGILMWIVQSANNKQF